MDPITIALLVGSLLASIGGTVGSIVSNRNAQKRQEEHDREMALLGQQIEDEQFAKQNVDFNKWSNEKSQMVDAGVNPALVYGGMSPNVGFQSAGGASAGNVNTKADFSALRGLSPSSWADYQVAEANGRAMRRQADSQAALNDQKALESMARTVELGRQTAFSKRMENIIYDTQTASLNEIRARIDKYDTENWSIRQNTMANVREVNSRIGLNEATTNKVEKELEQLQVMIDREPFIRSELSASARHLRAAAELADEERKLAVKKGKVADEEIKNIRQERYNLQESLKNSQIQRLAREFGLQQRRPNFDGKKNTGRPSADLDKNEIGFMFALTELGFTSEEAAAAAYYYSFGTLEDLSSEWIQAGSRAISGFAAGAGMYLSKGKGGSTSVGGSRYLTGNKQRIR